MAEARRLALDGLREAGDVCSVPAAEAAFYLLLNVPTTMGSMQLVERLVCEHRWRSCPGRHSA